MFMQPSAKIYPPRATVAPKSRKRKIHIFKSIKKNNQPVAEFKEFERRFKFKPRFKYGWFHLKLYQMFQDLSRRFI